MNKNNQSGFGIIEIILLLIIFGIIGFTGWRIYEAQKEIAQIPIDNSQVQKKKDDTDKNSQVYVSEALGIKFSYPKEWVKVECTDNTEALFLGTDNRGVGVKEGKSILCGGGTDFPAQMSFILTDRSALNEDAVSTVVKLDGKDAKKYVVVSDGEGLYSKGFETTTYTVDVKDKVLVMTYHKWPTGIGESYDTSSESKQKFIDLVEKSLRFLGV